MTSCRQTYWAETKEGFYTYDDKMKKGVINPEATKIVQKYVKDSNNTKPSEKKLEKDALVGLPLKLLFVSRMKLLNLQCMQM